MVVAAAYCHLFDGSPVTGDLLNDITDDIGNSDWLGETPLRSLENAAEFYAREHNYAELAQEYRQVQAAQDRIAAAGKLMTRVNDMITKKVVPERLDNDGMQNVTIKGVGRWQVASDMYLNTPKDQKEALQGWLIDHGHGALIQETVNASSLKALIREMMKKDEPIPEGIVNIEPLRS